MRPIPGTPPTELSRLVRAEDRVSFIYLERCVVHRQDNALTAADDRGVVHIPAATLGAVMLGPGTRVSHQAMTLLADSGSTVVWVGEQGVRYYAHGRGLSTSSRLVEAQARLVTNQSSRLRIARSMYAARFPGEDVSRLTMQQLRGREGARVRKAYREIATDCGVQWRSRSYNAEEFGDGDVVNQALSAATACLYGVVHAVVVALGASPALGFIHTGHSRSFVFDVADLYKVEIAVPVAFRTAHDAVDDLDVGAETRRRMRDAIYRGRLLERCARDIRDLLLEADPGGDVSHSDLQLDEVSLWDEFGAVVQGGRGHSDIGWAEPW
ncbi:MAG: type I-E CRISPR-associated endonuclease Cas1e [Dermatophilaceae bacterium]